MSVEPWIDAWPRSAMIAAAGPADVAEQELDDRRGADDLDADGVLRPADRVGERAGALAARVRAERLRDQRKSSTEQPHASATSSGV